VIEVPTTSDEDAKMIADLREISESEGKEIIAGIAIVVAFIILWWIVVMILFGGGWAS
jgi:hypothetical protein